MARLPEDSGSIRGSVAILTVLAIVFALMISLANPSYANHSFHVHQHPSDSGSCCVAVKGHSQTNPGTNFISAEVRHNGTYYGTTCDSGSSSCTSVLSPSRTFSYPVTVRTRHEYVHNLFHGVRTTKDVYYP